ncbi:MAG: 3-deoxy-D-manno-octulosonate 8-phosphate phosphatase (KDO 8-P phosphatase) [Paraglaciecola sp.]|jgi:3-deoxy-D-manno-octulosonate 8-phosphate phosphatase (KDO 8-P phosphatase)
MKLKQIKLLACDVDWIFSNGRIYIWQNGQERKAFNIRYGCRIEVLQKISVQIIAINGRKFNMVEQCMTALGMRHIYQGCEDKQLALQAIQKKLSVAVSETAVIGDDTSDLDTFQVPQFNICVQDNHPILAPQAHYKTGTKGGFGAVSELCDLIFLTNGQLDTIHGASI